MSLIELLVVMVILTIGIFAIVRIFPQGFRFITHARNVTLAGRLAQAEVERWKAAAANVPDGIEAEDINNGGIYTDYNPNDLNTPNPAYLPPSPTPDDLWHWTNVNRRRLVKGETTLIPSPTQVPHGGSNLAYSIYNLKFAPVEFGGDGAEGEHPVPAGGQWPDQYVLIYGDPMPRVNVTGLQGDALDNALDDLNRFSYAIDYDTGTVWLNTSWVDRTFKITYNYWDSGVLRNYTEVLTTTGTNGNQGAPDYESKKLKYIPDDYSELVARKFKYVPTNGAVTDFSRFDPYEFTILNGYLGTAEFAPTIGFNPRGANRTVRTNLGTRPLRAHIDYEVADWHVIHEDRTVPNPSSPSPGGYVIRLSVPGIKVAGRKYNDLTMVGATSGPASSLQNYPGISAGLNGYSVVALDMTDNTLILNNVGGGSGGLDVDYATGTVTVPTTVTKYTPFGDSFTDDVRGHMVRFFYQAVGDWAVQVTKAWSSYQRMTAANGLDKLQYNNFAAEIVAPGDTSATQPGVVPPRDSLGNPMWYAVLSFPRSNAGQSVSVSFIWSDVNNVPHEVTGRQYKLPEFATLNTGYPFIVIPFADKDEYAMPAGDQQWNNPRFTFVNGASLKVRVIWREDPRRWESRDLETFLTREQSDEDNS